MNTYTEFELINKNSLPLGRVKAAVFDFDGTISSLRCGWEKIMGPLMLEYLSPGAPASAELREEVERYIDESTGIQTVYQMEWLARRTKEHTGIERDPWFYKDEYNRRLALSIAEKKKAIADGTEPPENYIIAGALDFVITLGE